MDRESRPSAASRAAGEAPPSAHHRDNFLAYLQTIAQFRWRIALVMGLALLVSLLEVSQPRLIGEVIDRVLTAGGMAQAEREQRLPGYCLLLLVLILSARAADAVRDYQVNALNVRVLSYLRRRLYGHLLRFPLARLHQIKTGGIVSRLTGDLSQLSGLVQMALISPTLALFRVVLTFVIVSLWNSELALVLLLLLGPMAFGSFLWIGPIRRIWGFYWKRKGELDARISETFGGIRVVRAFQREEAEERRNALSQHTLARLNLHAVRKTASVHIIWGLLIPLANLMVLYAGGRMVFESQASIGQITGLMAYTGMLMGPVYQIVQTFSELQKSLAALDRVFDHLREPDEYDDPPDAVEAPSIQRLRFEHVGFAYGDGGEVLHDICLDVPRGATVALVGPSGAGKSTLADLVARFYAPSSGRITLNDIPLDRIRLYSYRRLLGFVSQDVFLFDGSIAENIAYGRPEATPAEIETAARQANAHAFIAELAEGYDTAIGERGVRLSGGQRQRLSIARAILADPQILILDEATSALDTESERLIQDAIERLEANRTTFVIAHRLSTVAHADMIVVLDHGHIVESGSHVELIGRRGRYWKMVEQQRQGLALDTLPQDATPTARV